MPTKADKKYIAILSDNYRRDYQQSKTGDEGFDLYLRLLMVTDYISGMTDSYARTLYRELTEIKNNPMAPATGCFYAYYRKKYPVYNLALLQFILEGLYILVNSGTAIGINHLTGDKARIIAAKEVGKICHILWVCGKF